MKLKPIQIGNKIGFELKFDKDEIELKKEFQWFFNKKKIRIYTMNIIEGDKNYEI